MSYIDHLIQKAHSHWGNDEELPAHLFSEMLSAGIDIAEAEKNFHLTDQYN
jgi:hypothetical protein